MKTNHAFPPTFVLQLASMKQAHAAVPVSTSGVSTFYCQFSVFINMCEKKSAYFKNSLWSVFFSMCAKWCFFFFYYYHFFFFFFPHIYFYLFNISKYHFVFKHVLFSSSQCRFCFFNYYHFLGSEACSCSSRGGMNLLLLLTNHYLKKGVKCVDTFSWETHKGYSCFSPPITWWFVINVFFEY